MGGVRTPLAEQSQFQPMALIQVEAVARATHTAQRDEAGRPYAEVDDRWGIDRD
ncbi:hypothetical protein ACTPOK_10045 [Streptomyces inhibens]|uniref:hypothetical protein n=1 Tax=Streptomyces inhibens TaxID=2293571 RepID=UPI00402AA82B